MKRKDYKKPEMQIVKFKLEDVVSTSGTLAGTPLEEFLNRGGEITELEWIEYDLNA